MNKTIIAAALLSLLGGTAVAQTIPPVRWQDEGGTPWLQYKVNCVGSLIACSNDISGKRTLITVSGSSGTVTSVAIGSGLSSTQSPLTTSGTMSVDQSFSPTWSGTHTFSNGIVDTATTNQILLGASAHRVTISSTAPAGAGQTLTIPDTAGADTFIFTTLAATLANKTLTAPIVNGLTAASGNDDFSGSSGTFKFPTGGIAASPTWGTDNTYSFGDATHRAVSLFSLAHNSGASTTTFTTTVATGSSGFIFNSVNAANDVIIDAQQNGTKAWFMKLFGTGARMGCDTGRASCEYGSPSFNSEIAITNTQVQLTEGSTSVNIIANEIQPGTDKVIAIGDATHGAKRLYMRGTSAVAGDYAASGGFGATSSFGTITGDDNHGRFTLTTSGNGEGANPTITYTFHDGTWTNAPFCLVHLESTTDTIIDTVQLTQSSSATALTMTYNGTPVDAKAYTFAFICIGG